MEGRDARLVVDHLGIPGKGRQLRVAIARRGQAIPSQSPIVPNTYGYDPATGAEVFDHPDGHPHEVGPGYPPHHAEPHVHATDKNGVEKIFFHAGMQESATIRLVHGDHLVRVRVRSSSDKYDQSSSIRASLSASDAKLLQVNCDKRNGTMHVTLA